MKNIFLILIILITVVIVKSSAEECIYLDSTYTKFPDQYKNCDTIHEITIEYSSIHEIPDEILSKRGLKKLQLVGLKNFDVNKFSKQLSKCHELSKITFARMNLKDWDSKISLPQSITAFNSTFDKWNNDKLPDNIYNLIKIEELCLWGDSVELNALEIGNFCNLKSLYLYQARLDYIPKEFDNLNSLSDVNIHLVKFKNPYTEFKKILKHIELTSLVFNEIDIGMIPDEIKYLQNLKTLCLCGDSIRVFPESLACLYNLDCLMLDKNKLTDIPKFIHQLEKLRSITLRKNNLKYFPKNALQLKSLESLLISGNNEIQEIPDEISEAKNLKMLDWSNLNPRYISDNIKSLKNLEEIWLNTVAYPNSLADRLSKLLPKITIQLSNGTLKNGAFVKNVLYDDSKIHYIFDESF